MLNMKRNARRIIQVWFLLVFPLFLFACSSTKVRQHPDFMLRANAAKTALLLPPQVEIVLITGNNSNTNTTRLSEEEAKVTKDLNPLVAAELSKRGFNVVSGQYQTGIDDNLETATTVKHMTKRLSDKLYWKGLPETEALAYKFTLGSEVASLAKQARVNSLVFVRFHAWKYWFDESFLQATLVDAATGDVLWGNEIQETSFFSLGASAFRDMIEKMVVDMFKPFPPL